MTPTGTDGVVRSRPAPLPTWFGVGGGADRLFEPADTDALRALVRDEPRVRVIGEGANLLIDDAGVREPVVSLRALGSVRRFDETTLRVGAGADLMRLVVGTVRDGLAGLESLAGIPASVGGALVMNAGGRFGEIGERVRRVFAIDRDGRDVTLERDEIDFGYRASGLDELIVTGADLRVEPVPDDRRDALRARLKANMAFKKASQPMGERSAGCVFRNPTLAAGLDGLGEAGERVSAGMLIDRAGCKGLSVNGASVSARHANFIVTRPGARARDVIGLIGLVRERVIARFGVALETEVVIWREGEA